MDNGEGGWCFGEQQMGKVRLGSGVWGISGQGKGEGDRVLVGVQREFFNFFDRWKFFFPPTLY